MLTISYNFLNQLYSKFLGRRTFYSLVLLLCCLFTIELDWIWLIWGVAFYFFIKPLQLALWHEYLAHRLIQPRNKIVEFLGLYILSVWELSGPKDKVLYHDLHHRYMHSELDPTYKRLVDSKRFLYFCLDLGKSSEIHYNKAGDGGFTSSLTLWFDKHYKKVLIFSLIVWLTFFPLWTWISFWLTPVFVWNFINRIGEYVWHHPNWQMEDKNWLVFILSQNAWHQSHHQEDNSEIKPVVIFNGPGLWKYFNWDYYIRLLFFKKFKEV